MRRAGDVARVMLAFPGSQLVELRPNDLAGHAFAYACGGYPVFPLHGKVPASPKRAGGNGVLDATTDLEQIGRWWGRWPDANIGGRVPEGVIVLDLDPRHDALEHLNRLEAEHGPVLTRTSWSGRSDGGRHFWFRHPGGRLQTKQLPGWDLRTHGNYVVLPPSVHPDTGGRYRWDDPATPIVAMPDWLLELVRPPIAPAPPPAPRRAVFDGDSIADWFTATRTWAEILRGWELLPGHYGEQDGSRWRHPTATSPVSATVKHGCLFVYSTSTAFEPTDGNEKHGYTKFRAWAVLEHGGDLSAAARAARELQRAAA